MNPLIQQFVTDYINGPDPYDGRQTQLLQELREFGTKQDAVFAGSKALRVYTKCLVAKKIALALRIENKYGHLFRRPSDSSIALGLALMATSKSK